MTCHELCLTKAVYLASRWRGGILEQLFDLLYLGMLYPLMQREFSCLLRQVPHIPEVAAHVSHHGLWVKGIVKAHGFDVSLDCT